ncbi:MAG: hypothetical protein ACRDCG_00510 [Mycoplasmoidaceae bacterium]
MKNNIDNNDLKNQKYKKEKKNLDAKENTNVKMKITEFLKNKHIPYVSRIYKIIRLTKENNNDKSKIIKELLFLVFGTILVGIFIIIAILAITSKINLNWGAHGEQYFIGSFLALSVIIFIFI